MLVGVVSLLASLCKLASLCEKKSFRSNFAKVSHCSANAQQQPQTKSSHFAAG
jgi:hypothetical protein